LALRCNQTKFLIVAIVAAKNPIRESILWEFAVTFLGVLQSHGGSGDWRIANLILWLSFGHVGELKNPILTVKDICVWTGHSERSAKRHLKRLLNIGFIARHRRSRSSYEYSIPEPILGEMYFALSRPPESIQ
jgi:hypothetical protein